MGDSRMALSADDGSHVVDALMIFRDGVTPQWEDAVNAEGGHFQFHFKANTTPGQLDEHWNNLVLGVVGATIEPIDMITGLRLVDKLTGRGGGMLRMEVWFRNINDRKAVTLLKQNEAVQLLQQNVERCIATRTLEGRVIAALPRVEVKNHMMTRHQ